MSTGYETSAAATTRHPCRDSVICAQGVNHWFGEGDAKTRALADVTLDIDRGEIVILTGPSGSGKTTLLTLIGALRRVQEGSLQVLGRDLARLDRAGLVRHRGDIGFVFQQHNLFSSLSAVENVRMATALKPAPVREMNRRALTVLGRLGMGERVHYLPAHLSGGQRQRVAIARALVNEPALVLADEPTASLDERSGQEVMDLLHELADGPGKTTVLIVTHDQRLLERAHRIVNMVSGRLVSNVQPSRVLFIGNALRANYDVMKDMDASKLTKVVEHMKVEHIPAGTVVVQAETEGDKLYVVLVGEAEALDVNDQVVKTLAPGDAFGRITAVSQNRVDATVRTRTPLDVATLSRADAEEQLRADQDMLAAVRRYLMARQ